jgi:hypothetical protein
MIQNGASRSAVQNAISRAQSGGGDVTVGEPTDVTMNKPGGGSGGSPFGGFFGGLPEGFTETNRFGGGAPIFTGPGYVGPGWTPGGSIFGGRGSPTVPGSGFLNNQSSLPTLGGGHTDYGADIALHSGRFRNALQNMGFNNLAQFQNQTGFTLPGSIRTSGAGVGGAGRPMTVAT